MTAGEVSINIYDHGVALDEKKQRVQCNYCGKVMSGFSRLKYHVGGIRGDVVPCEKVAVNVRESFRSMLLETKRASLDKEVQDPYHPDLPCKRFYSPDLNAAKRKKRDVNHTTGCGSGMHAEMHSVMEDDMTEHVSVNNRRTAMSSSGAKENVLSRQAQRCIGRFFYETGFDFSASTLPSFHRMINATLDDGQSEYKVPALQDLKGWILHDEVEEMKTYVKEISRSWASTGCSVLLDGWVDEKGRNLVSFVVECPGGPTYLRSADVSAIIDDVNALQMLLEGVIEEVGIDNVVQIVAFSTVGWVGAVGEQFMQRYWCVFWCVSASHCIELMLEKIGAMDSIRIALEKAKIITKFIYGHTDVLKLLRNHIDDYDLIKPSKMKLAMPFFTLENIVSEKKNLEEMFDSSEWKTSVWSSTVEGKRVADLVGDHSFWSGAEMASKAAVPLLCVLRLVNEGDKPQVGFIYETMDQVKETIKKEFKNKKSDYTPFWTAIDVIWDAHLHSPLHAAGYYLNPCLFYSPDFYSDPEVTFGLLCCLVRMVANQRTQLKITFQLDDYRHARGAFEEGKAIYKRTNVSPAQWWCTYGKQCPELQRFAVRILSQTCDGASRYGLKRSMAEKILTDRRNPIEQKRLRDMVFVHYNLQVQNKRFGSRSDVINEEIDPLDDWVVDEAPQEVVPENGDRGLMDSECSEDTTNVEGHRGFQVKEEPIEDKYNGLESDDLRDHLTVFAESLNKARAMIYPPTKKSSKLGEILPGLGEIVDKEHKILLARKSIIEKRKEEQERQLLEMEREEESRRLKQLKITEEAEHKRLAAEYEQRNRQRILREIEERELEEAQALLEEQEKRSKRKGGKKPILEGEKVTKQILMERALSEQLRERQEMEKKFQKLAKTMDYLERAKREEAAPLIEAAFQQRLVEEKALHEHEQQLETELSRQRHDGDLKEKYRLSRMLENKIIFEERVKSRREAEFNQRKAEREERINQIIQARKQEREALRKKIFFVRSEEERLSKLREEEEARKLEEAERRRKEEAERKAKLDEIAEKQRQRERELEEKERVRREALLGRTTDGPLRPSELPAGPDPGTAAPAAAAPAPAKYVPRFRRGGTEGSAPAPPETDKWGGGSSRPAPPPDSDKWSSGARQATADADRWGGGGRWGSGDSRPDDRNPPGDRWGGGSKSTWSSSRPRGR